MSAVAQLVCLLLNVFVVAVFGRIILSWFPMSPVGIGATVSSVLFAVTEPVLGPLRRVLPPVGMGGMGLDLSPIVVIIGVSILSRIIC